MEFLIFNNKVSAQQRLNEINDWCINNIWTDGVTTNYSSIYFNEDDNVYGIPIRCSPNGIFFSEAFEHILTDNEINSLVYYTEGMQPYPDDFV